MLFILVYRNYVLAIPQDQLCSRSQYINLIGDVYSVRRSLALIGRLRRSAGVHN